MDKFAVPALLPGIVAERELNAVTNRWMVIGKHDIQAARIGVFEVHFSEHLKGTRRHLARIRRQPVRHFERVLIGLVFKMATEGIADRRE